MPYVHIVICLALVEFLYFAIAVSRARGRYNVPAPAMTGNEIFERHMRVQMNTLENLGFFLPSMWLYALYVNDAGAAVGGLIWIAARTYYAVSYLRDPTARGPGALLTVLAQFGLFLGAAYGIVKALV